MNFINEQYSPEEVNLFNPAYVGIILYQAIREYQEKKQTGFHCALPYIVAPLSISPVYLRILPKSIATPIAGWVAENEGEMIGFEKIVLAYAAIVNSATAFLLENQAISLNEDGLYFLTDTSFPKKPSYIIKNDIFKNSFLASGLLGRWLSEAANVESVYAQLGIRP